MKITPYGIKTCSICDAPTTGVHRTDPDDELLPYCDSCHAEVIAFVGQPGQWFAVPSETKTA